MNLDNFHTHHLIDIRQDARSSKDFKLSDDIRNHLDGRSVFIFDTKDGQDVYFELKVMTRDKLIENMNKHKRAEKQFDAWLYSMLNK